MKKHIAGILMLSLIMSMSFALGGCKNKDGEASKNETGMAVVESRETAEETEDQTDEKEGEQTDEQTDEQAEEAEDISGADVVASFEPDAEKTLGEDIPMQIKKVELLKDGSVIFYPTDDLKINELGDSKATTLMPFAESGDAKVKELYLLRIGNGGYRTIVALMDNGTISAVNPRALIEDHIIAVKDNLGGRDSFIGVEQKEDDDAFGIIGKTEEGDDVVLNPVIMEEDGEVRPAE